MREHHRRVADFLRSVGASHVEISHRGTRHPRLKFNFGGLEHCVPISGTPGDWRSTRQCIAELKRRIEGTGNCGAPTPAVNAPAVYRGQETSRHTKCPASTLP